MSDTTDDMEWEAGKYEAYLKEKSRITKDCNHDCKIVCIGCDRFFHDIKNEEDLPHDEELPESLVLNCGDHYCHDDCYHDCH